MNICEQSACDFQVFVTFSTPSTASLRQPGLAIAYTKQEPLSIYMALAQVPVYSGRKTALAIISLRYIRAGASKRTTQFS
jgi:hypothetical protein